MTDLQLAIWRKLYDAIPNVRTEYTPARTMLLVTSVIDRITDLDMERFNLETIEQKKPSWILINTFDWTDSSEGYWYWATMYDDLIKYEELTLPNSAMYTLVQVYRNKKRNTMAKFDDKITAESELSRTARALPRGCYVLLYKRKDNQDYLIKRGTR